MFFGIFGRKCLLTFLSVIVLCVGLVRTPAQTTESNSDTDAAQSQAVELFNRGQDAHERSAFAEAVKFYEDALKIYSNFPEIEYQRGSALLSLGKTSEAEKAFRRALELRGDWTLAMSSLGALLVRENKFEEAEKILTQAIKLDEQNFPAFAALAAMRLRQKAAPDG